MHSHCTRLARPQTFPFIVNLSHAASALLPGEEVLAGLGHVAEGVRTAKSAYDLSTKLNVEMPITCEVYSVLYEDKPVQQAVRDLMARELGYEFDPRGGVSAAARDERCISDAGDGSTPSYTASVRPGGSSPYRLAMMSRIWNDA